MQSFLLLLVIPTAIITLALLAIIEMHSPRIVFCFLASIFSFLNSGNDCNANAIPSPNTSNIFSLSSISSTGREKELLQLNTIPSPDCNELDCEGPLQFYCGGTLQTVAWLFDSNDRERNCLKSKIRTSPEEVLLNFDKIISNGTIKRTDYEKFCAENFEDAPSLLKVQLEDWHEDSDAFERIVDGKMKNFAKAVHKIWPELVRTFHPDVHKAPKMYNVLPVPNPFIVPGGQFDLYFYWDSYWVLKGLYFSDLLKTARGMLENFAFIVEMRGYIPNSGHIRHSRRTQPAYFVQMIVDYFEATKDQKFLAEILPHADRELNFWQNNRTVEVADNEQKKHTLFQFRAIANCPRSDNLLIDYAQGMTKKTLDETRFFWSSKTSACESGWDFSTRWFSDKVEKDENGSLIFDERLLETNNVVPIDLNVLMALNYQSMAKLYGQILGDRNKSNEYNEKFLSLANSIEAVFSDKESGVWFDYDLKRLTLRKKGFFPSNIFPLMLIDMVDEKGQTLNTTLADINKAKCAKAIDYLNSSGALKYPGGVPTSLDERSSEQWDFPNQWAPLTHLLAVSLLKCSEYHPNAQTTARRVADAFLTTAYNGFYYPTNGRPAQMYEKYDVRFDNGTSGFGGEYPPQVGFGWTNGVVLELIRLFYTSKQ